MQGLGNAQNDNQIDPEEGLGKNPEQSLKITEEDIETAETQLERIDRMINDMSESEESEYTYSDLGTPMQVVDNILGTSPDYKHLKEKRKKAGSKIMRGTEEEQKEGFQEMGRWVEEVRELL